jgi:hypothetical protein
MILYSYLPAVFLIAYLKLKLQQTHFTNHNSGKCPWDECYTMKLILLCFMKGRFLHLNSYAASLDTFHLLAYGFVPVQRNKAMLVIVMKLCLKAEQWSIDHVRKSEQLKRSRIILHESLYIVIADDKVSNREMLSTCVLLHMFSFR